LHLSIPFNDFYASFSLFPTFISPGRDCQCASPLERGNFGESRLPLGRTGTHTVGVDISSLLSYITLYGRPDHYSVAFDPLLLFYVYFLHFHAYSLDLFIWQGITVDSRIALGAPPRTFNNTQRAHSEPSEDNDEFADGQEEEFREEL